jgi:pSer/pThr/pTyr-binding forkhead associated (FHA) protein
MKVVLELHQQSSNIRRVTVRHNIVIGRRSDCNLRISAPQVSRRHCFLRIDSNGVNITDLESSNGTWLNGQRTVAGKRYFVEDGMRLAIGPVQFIAHISDGPSDDDQSKDNVTRISPEHNSVLAPNAMAADSMDFAIEHAAASSEKDELTADYTADKLEPSMIDSSEIEIIGGDSEAVILLDDATEVIDASISVEALDIVAVEEIDDEDDIDDLLIIEEIDDDGADALQDFLQNND